MRKTLTFFVGILLVLLVALQIALPILAEKTLESKIGQALRATEVSADVSALPAPLLLLGHMDRVDISARDALLGEVRAAKLHLTGRDVDIPLDAVSKGQFVIKEAKELKIDGTLTAANLADLLRRQVDRLEDVTVTIEPSLAVAEGKAKIAGQTADIHVEGLVLEDDNRVYFRMTKLVLKNSLLGRAVIGNFFGDVEILDFRRLNLPVELDTVEMQDGQVVLTASQHKNNP